MGNLNLALARIAFAQAPATDSGFIELDTWCTPFPTDTAVGFQIYPVDPDDPDPVTLDIQYSSLVDIPGLDASRIWKTLKAVTSDDADVILTVPGTRLRVRADKACYVSFAGLDPIVTAIATGIAPMNINDLEGLAAFMTTFLKAADQGAARTAIGAGTSNFDGQYGSLEDPPTLGSMAGERKQVYQKAIGVPKLVTADYTISAEDDGCTITVVGYPTITIPVELLTQQPNEFGDPVLPTGFTIIGEMSIAGAYDEDYDFRLTGSTSPVATLLRQYKPDGSLVFRIEGRTT